MRKPYLLEGGGGGGGGELLGILLGFLYFFRLLGLFILA